MDEASMVRRRIIKLDGRSIMPAEEVDLELLPSAVTDLRLPQPA